MPTLHVRNVPEPIYEALRARAEREGRSIGSQTCVLLEQALLVETLKLPARRGASRSIAPWERFTPPARDVVARAAQEATTLGQASIDTEHLLLALLADESSMASHLFEALGVGREAVLERLEPTPAGKPRRAQRSLPFTAGVKEVLELALREALSRGHVGPASIDTEDLLLALAAYSGGRAAQILQELGVEESTVRAAAVRLRTGGHPPWFGPGSPAPAWEYQTLDLTGDSKAWSQQLNDAASEGWELFSVAESETPRAILRRPWAPPPPPA